MSNVMINIKGKLHDFSHPWVMGIVNVTPDSFYSRSRTFSSDAVLGRVERMLEDGADAIDIGGYSSRPGADEVSAEEEYARLASGLEIIRKRYPDVIVSVDTFRASVARKCVAEWDIDIINDISGGDLDVDMWQTVADLKVPYILMHMRGRPETMQAQTEYVDVTAEVIKSLAFKVAKLHEIGVNDIILDPGFGFAKTIEQNYQLLGELQEFHRMGLPLLVGVSHKSMIYKALNVTPDEALNGTVVLNTIALMKGANILRVHEVREAKEAVKLVGLMNNEIAKVNIND